MTGAVNRYRSDQKELELLKAAVDPANMNKNEKSWYLLNLTQFDQDLVKELWQKTYRSVEGNEVQSDFQKLKKEIEIIVGIVSKSYRITDVEFQELEGSRNERVLYDSDESTPNLVRRQAVENLTMISINKTKNLSQASKKFHSGLAQMIVEGEVLKVAANSSTNIDTGKLFEWLRGIGLLIAIKEGFGQEVAKFEDSLEFVKRAGSNRDMIVKFNIVERFSNETADEITERIWSNFSEKLLTIYGIDIENRINLDENHVSKMLIKSYVFKHMGEWFVTKVEPVVSVKRVDLPCDCFYEGRDGSIECKVIEDERIRKVIYNQTAEQVHRHFRIRKTLIELTAEEQNDFFGEVAEHKDKWLRRVEVELRSQPENESSMNKICKTLFIKITQWALAVVLMKIILGNNALDGINTCIGQVCGDSPLIFIWTLEAMQFYKIKKENAATSMPARLPLCFNSPGFLYQFGNEERVITRVLKSLFPMVPVDQDEMEMRAIDILNIATSIFLSLNDNMKYLDTTQYNAFFVWRCAIRVKMTVQNIIGQFKGFYGNRRIFTDKNNFSLLLEDKKILVNKIPEKFTYEDGKQIKDKNYPMRELVKITNSKRTTTYDWNKVTRETALCGVKSCNRRDSEIVMMNLLNEVPTIVKAALSMNCEEGPCGNGVGDEGIRKRFRWSEKAKIPDGPMRKFFEKTAEKRLRNFVDEVACTLLGDRGNIFETEFYVGVKNPKNKDQSKEKDSWPPQSGFLPDGNGEGGSGGTLGDEQMESVD